MRKIESDNKPERLEARVSKAQKTLFMRAAESQGRTLTDFVVASLQEAAEKVMRARDAIELSERDRKSFVAALLEPQEPGRKLRQAAKRYRKQAEI